MASPGLKKMLFFVNSNTDGVRVLVCPAIFCTLDGLCGRCLNHQAGVMPVYWLMFANVDFAYGRCHCHAFCGRCYCHCYVFLLADTIAIFCWLMFCHDLYIAKFVADVIATVAVVVTTCGNDVSFYCRCYGHF